MDFAATDVRTALKNIWNEFVNLKDGTNIMKVGMPLMLIWGQTPAFTAPVRNALLNGMNDANFDEYVGFLVALQEILNQNDILVDRIRSNYLSRFWAKDGEFGLIQRITTQEGFSNWEQAHPNRHIPYGRYFDMDAWIRGMAM